MSSKPKRAARFAKQKPPRVREKPHLLYPSLVQGPSPAERLAALEAQAKARGWQTMTKEEFATWLEEFRDLWPSEEEIEEFVAWVHNGRREGRYP